MALKKQTRIYIVTLVTVIFMGLGLLLYDMFFKKISYDETAFPAADIYRISPPAKIPDFNITNDKEEIINITKFKGKIILINFWATWCAPCIKELPQLDNLVEIIGKENIEILAISIDNSASIEGLKDFMDNLNIKNLAIYQDKTLEAYESLQSVGIPTTILVDKNLKAHMQVSGYLNWESPEIMNMINQLP